MVKQVGWWSPSTRTFYQMWEQDPSAPHYTGDAVPVYVTSESLDTPHVRAYSVCNTSTKE